MAGFSQGGGVGLSLASWIVDGDPGMDIFAMDVARFGDFATPGYARAKVQENYRRRFSISYPNEELPAARPLRTTPVYDRLKAEGAVFGAAFGLEHALWFAPPGTEPVENPTFRRSNAFEPVAEECRAVRTAVGMLEISNFAKYDVTGPDAEVWLSRILAGRLPRTGRMTLSPMLNPKGRIIGDFTVAKRDADHFMIFGSGPAESYHLRWFRAHLPDAGVAIRPQGTDLVGFGIAGPKSRDLLARLTDDDVSNQAFPFMSFRTMDLGLVQAMVGRISFTGELGYEIWVTPDRQIALYDSLRSAGADLGLKLFGGRALNSLRLEKSFGAWTREFTPDYTPREAGLDRFIDSAKNDFIGHDAVVADAQEQTRRKLVTLTIDVNDVDAFADEPVFADGDVIGWVTSGGYGHHVDRSIALAYLAADRIAGDIGYEVEILGERRPARLEAEPLFDPQGTRMRS